MPRRVRPYVELPLGLAFAFDFELDGGWYTVKNGNASSDREDDNAF